MREMISSAADTVVANARIFLAGRVIVWRERRGVP
jgi:hypothetical protein